MDRQVSTPRTQPGQAQQLFPKPKFQKSLERFFSSIIPRSTACIAECSFVSRRLSENYLSLSRQIFPHPRFDRTLNQTANIPNFIGFETYRLTWPDWPQKFHRPDRCQQKNFSRLANRYPSRLS